MGYFYGVTSMKIENNNYNVVQDSSTQRIDGNTANRSDATRDSDRTSQTADRVNLSSTSQQVDSLRKVVDAAADIRADKVAAIKTAVQNGNYTVDSQRIADALINGN